MMILGVVLVLLWSADVSGSCNVLEGTASCEDRKGLLDYHNEMRAKVARGEQQEMNTQSPAENMLEMRWSSEQGKGAQVWAERCTFEHSSSSVRHGAGENLALSTRTNEAVGDLVKMAKGWFDEVVKYGYEKGYDSNTGHYSQMIWGSSEELGCGWVFYKEDGWYKTFLVCRYKPGGNFIGEKPYIHGQPDCAKHGLYKAVRYNGLCSRYTEDEQKAYDPCAAESLRSSKTIFLISFCLFLTLIAFERHKYT